ncbi:hypothetical protein BT93_K2023 [Corymbia citriodora subsp. variegata]|nr:hypothetical protein BT93_K2023 [Corymbia citriodora subsp. variegata]
MLKELYCYEKDLECLPSGRKHDIEYKMIEDDFQVYEGKWGIEQLSVGHMRIPFLLMARIPDDTFIPSRC